MFGDNLIFKGQACHVDVDAVLFLYQFHASPENLSRHFLTPLDFQAACKRILTIGVFSHRETKRKLLATNTHLDHKYVHFPLHG